MKFVEAVEKYLSEEEYVAEQPKTPKGLEFIDQINVDDYTIVYRYKGTTNLKFFDVYNTKKRYPFEVYYRCTATKILPEEPWLYIWHKKYVLPISKGYSIRAESESGRFDSYRKNGYGDWKIYACFTKNGKPMCHPSYDNRKISSEKNALDLMIELAHSVSISVKKGKKDEDAVYRRGL